MFDELYALALTAGLVAALNPCGFALLPAYLSLLVAADDSGPRGLAVARALRLTAAMTTGFVAVFGLFGAVVVPLTLSVERYLPWATVAIGVALVGLGGWLLAGRELTVRGLARAGAAPTTTTWSMVVYGVAYAVASLSCTVGPLLAILTTTTRSGGVTDGVSVLVTYALGMGLVVAVLSVAVALAQQGVVSRARRLLPYVNRASGALLVIAGAYVAYYGWYELRVFSGGGTDDPVVSAARRVQGELARVASETGAQTLLVVLVCLVGLGLALGSLRNRQQSAR